jgi:hypothetical protein
VVNKSTFTIMSKNLPVIILSAILFSCGGSNQDAEKPDTATEAPCDSLELEMFDDAGNPYLQKVPCVDTGMSK